MKRFGKAAVFAAAVLLPLGAAGLAPGKGPKPGHGKGHKQGPVTVSVFASGFNNPRGLTFGPDGNLYVAEGGLGGSDSTVGQCDQVIAPVGPYTGSTNDPVNGGRISKVSPRGVVSTVVDALPSSQTQPIPAPLVSGVADVAFLHHQLYGLLAGAGCSHGVATVQNGVIRVGPGNSWTPVADLSTFVQTHPVAHPNPGDFEPDGTFYSMVAAKGAFYVVEPNHGEVDRVTPGGSIRRVVDVSAHFGHAVPTAIAHHGVFYLGNLGEFDPGDQAGDEHVYQLNPNGRIRVRARGLEKVLALAFHGGKLFALEMSTAAGNPVPGTGQIVRARAGRPAKTIVSGLMFPTGMAIGRNGAFYVSVNGFGFPAGAGTIPPHHQALRSATSSGPAFRRGPGGSALWPAAPASRRRRSR